MKIDVRYHELDNWTKNELVSLVLYPLGRSIEAGHTSVVIVPAPAIRPEQRVIAAYRCATCGTVITAVSFSRALFHRKVRAHVRQHEGGR